MRNGCWTGTGHTGTYEMFGIPRDIAAAHALFGRSPFDFERWAVSRINAQPNVKQVGDKGVDGVARFYLDKKTIGRVLVSVKGGKNIGPHFVRDLVGTVDTQKAQMGVLITMATPTRGVPTRPTTAAPTPGRSTGRPSRASRSSRWRTSWPGSARECRNSCFRTFRRPGLYRNRTRWIFSDR